MKLAYAYSQTLKNPLFLFESNDINLYKQIYNLDADGWLVDRTQTLQLPFNETLLEKYKIPQAVPVEFKDAAISHANELLDTNEPIFIMWSGGIDSTAIVVSFIETGRSLNNVTIILNSDSVKEYESFYRNFILPKFKILVTEEAMMLMSQGVLTGIVVSGELADQLVGSPMVHNMHQLLGNDFVRSNFTFENFKKLCSAKNMNEQSISCWFDLYQQTMVKSPKLIKSMFDFAWWHGFNFRWQSNDLKMYLRIHKNINLKTFYSSVGFQQWSINFEPDLHNLQSLKAEIKSFVNKFTNDSSYTTNKIKHPSSTLYYAVPACAALDENLNKVYHDQFNLLDFHIEQNSITEWLNKT